MSAPGLEKAISLCGGVKPLAKRLEMTYQAVYVWRTNGVPVTRCLDVEKATNGAVTRQELRPDYYN